MDAKFGIAVLEPLFGRLCLDLSGEFGRKGVGLSEVFGFELHEGSDQDCMPMENGVTGDEFGTVSQSLNGRYIVQIKGNGCLLCSQIEVVEDEVGRVDCRICVVKRFSECGDCLVEVGAIEFEAWDGRIRIWDLECRFDEEVEVEGGG